MENELNFDDKVTYMVLFLQALGYSGVDVLMVEQFFEVEGIIHDKKGNADLKDIVNFRSKYDELRKNRINENNTEE